MSELIAFAGHNRIAAGSPAEVAGTLRILAKAAATEPTLVFETKSGRQVDLDLRLSDEQLLAQFEEASGLAPGRGRPKLGVISREVTLLPRHWEWLGQQRGGASAALRRLVDEERRDTAEADGLRQAQEAVHRFITVMAGDAPGYEEAVRALFAGDRAKFEEHMAAWPTDVRAQALDMTRHAFALPPSLAGLVAREQLEAATAALREVFGQEEVRLEPLTGRSGATVLKASGTTLNAVLRLDVTPDGFRDPARHYACHAIAAHAGVAPDLLHVNLSERLTVSAFIEPSEEVAPDKRLTAIGEALSRLHATPLFPPLMPFMQAMDGLMTGFASLGVLPRDAIGQLLALFDALRGAYEFSTADIVSSHNDLNPTNILCHGARAYFVDWETAFAADRYVDLAALVNFLARNDRHEQLILTSYFGRDPTADEMRRLNLMRQVSRLYYGVMLLRAAARGQPDLRLGDGALIPGTMEAGPATEHPLFEVRLGCAFLGNALRHGASETGQ